MNIFLVIFDTLRKDHTGKTYGNNWIATPNYDAFAKDALIFENAYPESLPTLPMRRSTHTGIRTFPFNHEKPKLRSDDFVESPGWYPIPPQHTHMAEYLNKNAYITSFITSTYHQFKPNMNYHLGFDEYHFIRGHEHDKYKARMTGSRREINDHLRNFLVKKRKNNRAAVAMQKLLMKSYLSNVQDRKNEDDYFPAQTFKTAIDSINRLKDSGNIFCVIDEFDPHEPWDPPQDYYERYIDKTYSGKKIIQPMYGTSLEYISEEELGSMRACYAGEVTFCDKWFGYFIRNLKEMDLYDDSLILLISDHGHSIGEHGAIGKIPTHLYPELVDIPFMIKPPGNIKGPKRIKKTYVYNHDILPTLFGFLDNEQLEVFDGIDLSKLLDNSEEFINNRDYITCGMALWTLYKDDNYAFITGNNKSYQKLYDLSKDTLWENDISSENQDLCDELFTKISADAQGNLLRTFNATHFESFEDWYQNTHLK
jgi:arylsulfatase A-like enzyme